MIWGEHAGFIKHFARAYFEITTSHDTAHLVSSGTFDSDLARLRDIKQWNGFLNPFDIEGLVLQLRAFMHALFAGKKETSARWGFKEIRYSWNRHDLTPQFLRICFPKSQFLILVRNPVDTVFSMLSTWCREIGNNIREMDREILSTARHWARLYERLFLLLHTTNGYTRIIRYEDFSQNEFDKLTEFLNTKGRFDYEKAASVNNEPSVKDDEFSDLIRVRSSFHYRRLNQITEQTRSLYGYTQAWEAGEYL